MLEAKISTDSTNFIAAQASYQQNTLQLKGLLNLDAALPFEVEIPAVDKIAVETLADLEPSSVFALALANQPLQKSITLKIKAQEKNIQGKIPFFCIYI